MMTMSIAAAVALPICNAQALQPAKARRRESEVGAQHLTKLRITRPTTWSRNRCDKLRGEAVGSQVGNPLRILYWPRQQSLMNQPHLHLLALLCDRVLQACNTSLTCLVCHLIKRAYHPAARYLHAQVHPRCVEGLTQHRGILRLQVSGEARAADVKGTNAKRVRAKLGK